jgi:hypothetical protein
MPNRKQTVKSCQPSSAGTIIIEMKPYRIGRVLGVGLRVAGKMAGEQMAARAQSASTASATQRVSGPSLPDRAAAQVAGQATRNLARGVGGFLRPFGRVGRNIMLEVVGAFFLLFALAASLYLWRFKPSHLQGPYDKNFLAAAGIAVVFLYLSLSSFWRARSK